MPAEVPPLDRLPREGEVLAGRYRIGRVLGQGAMGIVVEAQHLHLGERLAIKFMTAERRGDPRAIARFREEARSARQLQSPHIVRIHEFDVWEDGVPYMVMEYLPGMDLGRRLALSGSVAVEQAVDWILQACEGVAEAHRHGIVHRDLKPTNLFMFEREGSDTIIKVLDFGISKNVTGVARTVDAGTLVPIHATTGENTFLGSAPYMSPEQMTSAGEVDHRTDLWSLGVTLFQLVTGELPFCGQEHLEIYKSIILDSKSWKERLQGRARDLEPVLAKCFEVDRALRYRTVSELVLQLGAFAPTRHDEQPRHYSRTSTLPSVLAPALPRPAPKPRSDRASAVIGKAWPAAVAILALLVSAAALLGGFARPQAQPSPSVGASAASPIGAPVIRADPPAATSVLVPSDVVTASRDALSPTSPPAPHPASAGSTTKTPAPRTILKAGIMPVSRVVPVADAEPSAVTPAVPSSRPPGPPLDGADPNTLFDTQR